MKKEIQLITKDEYIDRLFFLEYLSPNIIQRLIGRAPEEDYF